jgi:Carboxypeptidase regulatory-like domain/TonB dependent receptor
MKAHRLGMWVGRFLVSLLALMAFAGVGRAQSTTAGAIVGIVRDPSGAVIPDATVNTTSAATNSRSTATTDANGRYVIDNLRPGRYSLEVAAKGFGSYKQENVIVEVGLSTTVDAQLQVAAQTATVIATAEAPVVTTDNATFSTNINSATIENLPINGRRWSAFKLLTPGAAPDAGFGLVSFRGISGLLNNNTVDGGDNNQAFFSEEKGRTRISYSMSEAAIQEYQVNTSDYSAEYGRSAGGVINAVTKSGTNNFHGEAFWYFRDSDFSAINPFAVQTVLVNGVNTSVHINPEDKQHQFGGTIGGPIIKDKLFFFFSADQQLRKFPAVAGPGNPASFFAPLSASELTTLAGRGISASQANAGLAFLQSVTGTVPRTGDELVMLPKIDWDINSRNHFSAEYNRMRWSSPGGIQTGAVVSRGVDSFGDDFVKDDTVIARLDSSLTALMTNQFLFEYGRDFEFESNSVVLPGEPVATTTGFSPQISISGGGGITFGMPNFLQRPAFPDERRYQWTDTLALSHGTHLFKFGFDINRVNDLDQNLFQGFGVYSYGTRVDFISDYVAFTSKFSAPPCGSISAPTGCYSSFNQDFGPLGFGFTTVDTGLFANDEWRIRPRLTLNLGLRYDRESLPSAQIANPSLPQSGSLPNDNDAFGPRVGIAWDLTGKGTTVIRGGYGIYYGRIINANIFNAIAETGNPAGQLAFSFLPSPGAPLYPNIAATPPAGTLNPPNVVVVGKDLQLPTIHQFDAVFEHQIARNTAVSVSYIGSIGRNLPTYIDENLSAPTGSITYTVSGGSFNGQTFTVPLFTAGTRPNPAFGAITNIESIVHSHYNALAIQFNRRMTDGLQVQAFYTYSNAQDNGQSSNTGTPVLNVFNPFQMNLEDGTSTFNLPHRFVTLALWQPDYYRGEDWWGKLLLNGFSISPIITAQSGAAVTGTISGNAPTGSGALSSGINGSGTSTNRAPWIPRNSYQMPRLVDVDLQVAKAFSVTEHTNVKLFVQAFNLFNHVIATGVDTTQFFASRTSPTLTYNTDFMHVTASSNSLIGQRFIQIGATLNW